MPILHMALQKCQSRALLLYLIVRRYEGLYFKMAKMWKKTHIDRMLKTSFYLAKKHSQPMVLHRQNFYIWLYAQEYPRCILSYKRWRSYLRVSYHGKYCFSLCCGPEMVRAWWCFQDHADILSPRTGFFFSFLCVLWWISLFSWKCFTSAIMLGLSMCLGMQHNSHSKDEHSVWQFNRIPRTVCGGVSLEE